MKPAQFVSSPGQNLDVLVEYMGYALASREKDGIQKGKLEVCKVTGYAVSAHISRIGVISPIESKTNDENLFHICIMHAISHLRRPGSHVNILTLE